jgi:hypothetical protein
VEVRESIPVANIGNQRYASWEVPDEAREAEDSLTVVVFLLFIGFIVTLIGACVARGPAQGGWIFGLVLVLALLVTLGIGGLVLEMVDRRDQATKSGFREPLKYELVIQTGTPPHTTVTGDKATLTELKLRIMSAINELGADPEVSGDPSK